MAPDGSSGCRGWAEAPDDGPREEVAWDWAKRTWAAEEWGRFPSRRSAVPAGPSSWLALRDGRPTATIRRTTWPPAERPWR